MKFTNLNLEYFKENGFSCERIDLSNNMLSGVIFKFRCSQNEFIIHPYATGNCQLSTVMYACAILQPTDEDSRKFFEYALYSLAKDYHLSRILLMDLNERYVNDMKRILKPYYEKFYINRYKSTNSSDMVICRIVLKPGIHAKLIHHYDNVNPETKEFLKNSYKVK